MGCLMSCGGARSLEKHGSVMIDIGLRKDSIEEGRKMKLLLLGAGEAGKSTFKQQLIGMFGASLLPGELASWAVIIHGNIVDGLKLLLLNVEKLDDASLEQDMDTVAAWPSQLTPEMLPLLDAFWADAGVQAALKASKRVNFKASGAHSLEYFVNNDLGRIAAPDYEPTLQDIVHAHAPTIGFAQEELEVQGQVFEVCEIGGTHKDRALWLEHNDNVTAIVFVVDVSAYADPDAPGMDDALGQFRDVCKNEHVKSVPIILFLNKADVLRKNLETEPFRVSDGPQKRFADFEGDPRDFEAVEAYLTRKFRRCRKPHDRALYVYTTDATDPETMRSIFKACRDIVVMKGLNNTFF